MQRAISTSAISCKQGSWAAKGESKLCVPAHVPETQRIGQLNRHAWFSVRTLMYERPLQAQ